MDSDYWSSISDAFGRFFNSDGFRGAMGSAIPSIAGGLASGGVNALFQGSNDVRGADTRTSAGKSADDIRLGAAGGAGKQYGLSLQGRLDPREEYNIRKGVRSASGASGLETGGNAVREQNAVSDQVSKNKREGASQVSGLTGGFQGKTPYRFDRPNLWAGAMTGPVGRGVEKGFDGMMKSWSAPRQQTPFDDSNLGKYRSGDDNYWA